jgi:hypothetical protein
VARTDQIDSFRAGIGANTFDYRWFFLVFSLPDATVDPIEADRLEALGRDSRGGEAALPRPA